jgi:hypothetical protein
MFTRRAGLAFLLVALVCATLPALADSTARIVRLSYLDSDVQIDRGAGQGLERAVLNLPVIQGTQLATHDGATAEVEFEDGSTLRLVPDTTVDFRQLSLRSSGDRVSSIELAQGTAYLQATTKKDAYALTAGGQEITLTHDARLRISRTSSALTLAVFKGEAELRNPNGSVRVKKDETLNLDLNDPSQYQLVKGVDPQSYDAWNQQRDKYRQTYASNHQNGYNSLYSYGWSDLNYFGGFYPYGSYGMLWRPYGVGPGWDPFADGAWMYYPGYGYTWVSGYPWGWMPYRYGSWMFVPGYGWGWSPATVWNTWYATPVIYGAPPGYVAPAPPVVKPAPGTTAPKTVVVGSGPIVDVRNPRFRQWVTQTRSASAPARKTSVAPVPAPAPTTTALPSGSRKTTTSTAPATTSPARTNTRTASPATTTKPAATPSRPSTPPPSAPPKTEAPRMSAPPNARVVERSSGWSESSRSSGGSAAGSASRSATSTSHK